MTLSENTGASKRLRRTPWRFQRTFSTPLKNLEPFVTTICSAQEPFQGASVTIDQIVFEPKHLLGLFTRHALPEKHGCDLSITASDHQEVQDLLHAALSDWIDFFFVPIPKPFVIYADHDEFTTFYANAKSNLMRVTDALTQQGFEWLKDYER